MTEEKKNNLVERTEVALKETPTDGVRDSIMIALAGFSGEPITAISTLFATLFKSPIDKRIGNLLLDISTELVKLSEKVDGIHLQNIIESEVFVSTISRAGQIVTRNHQVEKLEALRNAVLNTAANNLPEDSLQQMFMEMIDTLTPWHLKLLRVFDDGLAWQHLDNIDTHRPVSVALLREIFGMFPELSDQFEFVSQLIHDLQNRSLINNISIKKTVKDLGDDGLVVNLVTPQGQLITETVKNRGNLGATNTQNYVYITTGLGKQFINFITSPLDGL